MPGLIKRDHIDKSNAKLDAKYFSCYLPLSKEHKKLKKLLSSDFSQDGYINIAKLRKKINFLKSHPNKQYLMCSVTYKSRGINRYFRLCRGQVRFLSDVGLMTGIRIASDS